LQSGSVFVFADDDFTWVENENPYAGLALGFDEIVLGDLADKIGAPRPDLRSSHFETDETLLAITKLMAAELTNGGCGADLYRDSLATLAKVHLLRRYGGLSTPALRSRGALSRDECARVHDFMVSHLDEALTLEALGRVLSLSPYHFARLFKAATGKPPHQYLTMLRIKRARILLTETRLPISAIAWRVGFSSLSQFGTQFKRLTGAPPAAFRSHGREQESEELKQEPERRRLHVEVREP
jgi:AraC family transcriptional regulator